MSAGDHRLPAPGVVPARSPGLSARILDRFYSLHDRLVASPRFQAFAQTFWMTRPVARHHAKALFDLSAGFIHAQVLLACVRLDLFEMLRAGPLPPETIARRTGLPPDGAIRLLEAAAGLKLLRRQRDGFGLGTLGAALLGNPGAVAMIEHHPLLYQDLADPVACFAGPRGAGALARYWAYGGSAAPGALGSEETGGYSALMAASQPFVARQILQSYPVGRHRSLMDVGGGSGAFLTAVAARHSGLQLSLFDLPSVAQAARDRFDRLGLGARVAVHEGDFSRDPLPEGADLISLVRIVHDHDDEPALHLLRSVRQALAPGGALLLAEPMSGTPGAETLDSYFAVYLHALGSGRLRSAAELTGFLNRAGFARVRRIPTAMPLLTSLLVAQAN